ncbi:sigma factor [Pseudarthrobacter sp. NamE5]|uniref:sigma factor n=1 Tax=Pseudarthrobacter sp. NamE5 TaxID=2576839 RepID=UPI00110A4320|nr:hypothetical protein FDW84_01500 [Pseudarthrobacter sp. NamE5]
MQDFPKRRGGLQGPVCPHGAAAVRRLAVQVVKRSELAEEVVQEVLVQVWLSAGRFDPSRGEPRVWLFTLTHRSAVEVVRREQTCHERDSRHDRETTALGQATVKKLILRRGRQMPDKSSREVFPQ